MPRPLTVRGDLAMSKKKLNPIVYSTIQYPTSVADIELGRTPKGGFNKATIEFWGLSWRNDFSVKGWQQRLIDTNNNVANSTTPISVKAIKEINIDSSKRLDKDLNIRDLRTIKKLVRNIEKRLQKTKEKS